MSHGNHMLIPADGHSQADGGPVEAATFDFEGNAIRTFFFKDQLVWIAREIGRAIGYADDGKRLLRNIGQEWSDEFIRGIDCTVLEGRDLAMFKRLVPDYGTSRAPSLMLLTETGFNMVCLKTDKPGGKVLRRKLAEEVIPAINRTGCYVAPGAQPPPTRSVDVDPKTQAQLSRAKALVEREERLRKQFELKERKIKAKALLELLESCGSTIDPTIVQVYQVKAAELVTDMSLDRFLPVEVEKWEAPAEIARRLGSSEQEIGLCISAAGIRQDERYCRDITNKSRTSSKTMTTYKYNPAGVVLIEAKAQERAEARQSKEEAKRKRKADKERKRLERQEARARKAAEREAERAGRIAEENSIDPDDVDPSRS